MSNSSPWGIQHCVAAKQKVSLSSFGMNRFCRLRKEIINKSLWDLSWILNVCWDKLLSPTGTRLYAEFCIEENVEKSCWTMWGEERNRKEEQPFFHIYAVTLFVKHQRRLQWIYAWVCDIWHANTHKSESVAECTLLVWKCHCSRFIGIGFMIIRNLTLCLYGT